MKGPRLHLACALIASVVLFAAAYALAHPPAGPAWAHDFVATVDWSGSPASDSIIHFFPVPDGQDCTLANAICEEWVFYSTTLTATQIRDTMYIAFNTGSTTCEQEAYRFHSHVLPGPEQGNRQQILREGSDFDLCVFDDVNTGVITKVVGSVGTHSQNGITVQGVEALPIPTLSQWGVITFGIFLLTAMALGLRRMRAA